MFYQRRAKNRIREKNLRIQKTKNKCTNSQSFIYSVQLLLTLSYYKKKKRENNYIIKHRENKSCNLFDNFILCKKSIDILIYYINETYCDCIMNT